MNLSHFLTILRARWVSAAAVFFTIVVVVMTASWFFPKNYTATASVLVDVKSPDPVAGVMMHAMTVPSYMATQADLIQSDRVARRAIDLLGLMQNGELRQQWVDATDGVGDYGAWLATALSKNLDVQPSKDSNVLSISFKSRDPNFSSAVANAYVKGYIDTTLELKTEPARQFNAFFDERAKGLRQELEDAQRRLSEFQKSRGIVANDERLDVENMRLAEISSQVVILEAAAVEAASRQTQAGATPDRMQEVLNNPVVVSLQADLSRQEARLGELSTRLGEANPQVIEARTVIEELRRKLQAAVQSASGSVSVTSNVAQQRLGQLRAAREEQRA
jgi:chain length determinant protein EpsF